MKKESNSGISFFQRYLTVMMMKVDFKSIKNIGKNPKGLFVTWIVNWLGRFRRAFVQMMKQ